MRSAVALFLVLAALWLLNSGHYGPLMLFFCVGSCLFVVVLSRRMGVADEEGMPVHLALRAAAYLPWLLKEIVVSNIDVAKRVLRPGKLRISPRIIETPTTQHSDLGRVIFANSITLTPGTISIQVRGSHITVHALADEVADGLLGGEMDRRVTRLEGPAR